MKVRQGLVKFISPDTPVDERLKTARCEEPAEGPLEPNDRLTLLFVLSHDKDAAVAEAARQNLSESPARLVQVALEKKLDPLVIKKVVELHTEDPAVLSMAVMN